MKKIDFFKVVPEKFFVPLSSLNKSLYIEVISLLYNSVQNGLSYGIEKEIMVSAIEDFLEGQNVEMILEEEEECKNTREKANLVLRNLIQYGWIYSEVTINYKTIINFHDYSITMIETFLKLVNKESVEYRGNIITIYTLLVSGEDRNAWITLRQVYENTKEIITSLKSLNSNIKKYMDNLTQKMKVEEILEDLFGKYTREVLDKSYHKLKTSENISRYRPKIIEILYEKLGNEEFLNSAISVYIEDVEAISSEDAKEEISEMIVSIINAFNDIDDITNEIDIKNTKYIRASVTRAKFLLNNSKDMVGVLKDILEFTCSEYKKEELSLTADSIDIVSGIFSMYIQGYYDETSLYISNEGKKSFKPSKVQTIEINPEERKNKLEAFKKKQSEKYSPKKVNQLVEKLLGEKSMIEASEIEINNKEDYIKIIYISVYANNHFSKYKIKRKERLILKNGFKFRNFEIWRKK
ncbi:MAG: Wadjet anti-phage system protein JetA family protein [Sarcina sp.]